MLRLRRTDSLPTGPVEYPLGTFIRTEKGYFYILDNNRRYRCLSRRVVDSWSPHRIVVTSEAAVSSYRISAKLKFRNGSLIWNISDGKLYLIESGKRRHVQTPDALKTIGAVWNDAITVSLEEVNLHEEGAPLI